MMEKSQCRHLEKEGGELVCSWNKAVIRDPENCNHQVCPEGFKEK